MTDVKLLRLTTGEDIVAEVTNQQYSDNDKTVTTICLLYTSPSPRDLSTSRMPSSA